ncbi:hypothetical protein, partial [Paracoccus saliphilus]|uniref:hypothetical protein n=1 Tax=Paracoccus saliphilus TaxID=405559 RepID=UPI0026574D8A
MQTSQSNKQPNRPHISSDSHQCQKAEETKSRKMRHTSDAPTGRSFPNCLQTGQSLGQPGPSSVPAFGEAVSTDNNKNPQEG